MAGTSKTPVATVTFQPEAEGRLSPDDTVEHWLPGAVRGNGDDGRGISVCRLLRHTSGIHDDLPGYTTPEEYSRQRHQVHELFGPGSRGDVADQIPVYHDTLSWVTTTWDENHFLRALLSGRLLPKRQQAETKRTVPVSAEVQQPWPGGDTGSV
ncbi:serine hydrolase [Streptomyces vietnamensis]|uniref:serine hydrolase n=1 Tax=Streptomyces vietnamensis TaxID=362257 RepID=UPI003798996E